MTTRWGAAGGCGGERGVAVPWIKACSVDDLEPGGEGVRVDVDPPIAVFNVDGEFYAIDDTCSHGQSSLAEGYVEGCTVECNWHFAKFDLRTGRALCLPATVDLRTYPVRVEGGEVYVEVTESIAATLSDIV